MLPHECALGKACEDLRSPGEFGDEIMCEQALLSEVLPAFQEMHVVTKRRRNSKRRARCSVRLFFLCL